MTTRRTFDVDGKPFEATDLKYSDDVQETLRHAERTVQDIYDQSTPDEQEVINLVVGAAVDDVTISDPDILASYDRLSEEQKNFVDFIVAGALSGASDDVNALEHADDMLDDFLEHHGVKGQKWGVRKGELTVRDSTGNHTVLPGERRAARERVAAGTGTLGDAHMAALKSKGRRVVNALLGDKTYWKRTAIIAGVTVAGLGLAVAVPGLLPASLLAHLGVSSTAGGALGVAKVAAAATQASGTLVTPHAAAVMIGHGVISGAIAGTTATAAGAAQLGNKVSNVARAVRGNARINKSYDQTAAGLGKGLMDSQRTASTRVQKVLNRNGSINTKMLHSEIENFDSVGEFLAHHGVKGQRWGVRRDLDSGGSGGGGESSAKSKLGGAVTKLAGLRKKKSGEEEMPSSTPEHNKQIAQLKKEDPFISADTERTLRTIQKEGHEMSTQEMRDAANRMRAVEEYNKFFGAPAKSPLQQRVDELNLEVQYRDLKKQLTPEKRSNAQKLIGLASTGFSGYQQVDKALGGNLSAALGRKFKLTEPLSELQSIKQANDLLKAKIDNVNGKRNLSEAEKKAVGGLKKTVADDIRADAPSQETSRTQAPSRPLQGVVRNTTPKTPKLTRKEKRSAKKATPVSHPVTPSGAKEIQDLIRSHGNVTAADIKAIIG